MLLKSRLLYAWNILFQMVGWVGGWMGGWLAGWMGVWVAGLRRNIAISVQLRLGWAELSKNLILSVYVPTIGGMGAGQYYR